MDEDKETERIIRMKQLFDSVSKAREALQACDNFLDYSHAGIGNQCLAYRYVKMLISDWLKENS